MYEHIFIKVNDDWTLEEYFPDKEYVTLDDIMKLLDNLHNENNDLKEEITKLKLDIQEKYRPISISEEVCISDKDFY